MSGVQTDLWNIRKYLRPHHTKPLRTQAQEMHVLSMGFQNDD